ncbi:MAG: hypothetical protein GY906_09905 [bacterium]|nr:hypothetical protein [bacterium]
MAPYMGGSAPAMARQICDGFHLVSVVSLKRLQTAEFDTLIFELEKKLRDARSEIIDVKDTQATQQRNRRILRIEGALRTIRGSLQTRRRKGGA